MKDFALDNINF